MDIDSIHLIGVALGSLGIGVAVLIGGLKQRNLAERAQTWPVATAEVTRSEVMEEYSRSAGTLYEAKIEYVYEAGGSRFTGDTVAIGGVVSTSRRDDAQSLCTRYFPGARVAVHYDRMDPATSCLELGGSGWQLLCGAGTFFALLGAGILIQTAT